MPTPSSKPQNLADRINEMSREDGARAARERFKPPAAPTDGHVIEANFQPPTPEATPEVPLLADVDAYYDAPTKEYYLRNTRGVWLPLNEGQFKRHLRSAGFTTKPKDGELVSQADNVILQTQNHRDIQYAGRLCGRKMGFYDEGGTRFLVTSGFELPKPTRGQWRMINAVVDGLLKSSEGEHGDTQIAVFHGWIQTALVALAAERIQSAQALALAGPAGSGKSLLQALITEILGGRAAKAARYMQGATPFNGDLFEAEHLVLEDEFMSTKISDRQRLAAAIKNATVSSRLQSCHRKNRQAVTLPAWWRVSITLNDDAEAMMVLPPLDEHVQDKIILLRGSRFDFPMPMSTSAEQEAAWEQLKAEVPAYSHWLLNDFQIPAALADPRRYVVRTWHHPALRTQLESLSPESTLLDMIDEAIFPKEGPAWRGTAAELQRLLLADYRTEPQARRLLDWPNACGTYLGRLAHKQPDRVEESRTATRRDFIIRELGNM